VPVAPFPVRRLIKGSAGIVQEGFAEKMNKSAKPSKNNFL
jgi:hypothetical protein